MVEKRAGKGEDSEPLSLPKEAFCAVGVFDGMGGAGAVPCNSSFGEGHTKAYVASRIVEKAVYDLLTNSADLNEIKPDKLHQTIAERLQFEREKYPTKASGLRSRLVREYPTTLAVITASRTPTGSYEVVSYWAGDSHNYLWNSEGFYQISKDDLNSDLDPLENLHDDASLSNCVCADRDFVINEKRISTKGKFVIFSATDGCFGYLPTPMHFNELMRSTLADSQDCEEWQEKIKKETSRVTGDDTSLSLIAIGYEDFDELKDSLGQQSIKGIDKLNRIKSEISKLKQKIKDEEDLLQISIQEEWDNYKSEYLCYLTREEEAQNNKGAIKSSSEAAEGAPNDTGKPETGNEKPEIEDKKEIESTEGLDKDKEEKPDDLDISPAAGDIKESSDSNSILKTGINLFKSLF